MGKTLGALLAGFTFTLTSVGISAINIDNAMKSEVRTAIYAKADKITPKLIEETTSSNNGVNNIGFYLGSFMFGAAGTLGGYAYSELRKKEKEE